MTVGERIRQRRLELKLTQEEVADLCGYVHRSSINKIEKCRNLPLGKIRVIAEVLQMDPYELFDLQADELKNHIDKKVAKYDNEPEAVGTLGTNLRRLRKQQGLTLKDMADRLDITFSVYQKYETGKVKNVNITMVEQFAKALNTSPAVLVGWEEDIF